MKLNSLFSDHAVLQRDRPIPVWGWAAPGEKVSLSLAGQIREVTADETGNFRVTFHALSAGGPHILTAKGAAEELVFQDILVGEVWLCSGQSNMQWTVQASADYDVEAAAAQHPNLRMFTVPNVALMEVQADAKANWTVCDPDWVFSFSAVGYFFAREIQQRLGGIPVGMINSSYGGTMAEAWTSREGLLAEPELHPFLAELERNTDEERAAHELATKEWMRHDPGDTGWAQGWAKPNVSEAEWSTMTTPGSWQSKGMEFSGVLWFRREVTLPDSWAGRDLQLSLGVCDKSDITWFNDELVGSIKIEENPDAWNLPRLYTIPGKLVKAGRNVIAVRIYSNVYSGGLMGPKEQMFVALAGDEHSSRESLTGPWSYRVEANFGLVPSPPYAVFPGDGTPNTPTILFNSMIAPLVPFALRGVIWYQGEGNASRAMQYRTLFPALIRDWRRIWAQGDFPFHYVQLPNWTEEGHWAEMREAQAVALKEPNTAMVVTIDIGDAADVHPTNKQDVGRRLALSVLAREYGQDVTPSGPMLRDWEVAGNSVRLSFDYAEGGLVTQDHGAVRGFAIAGNDRDFQWAWARIEGDSVIVRHPKIPNPVAVRYAWSDNPSCNLINRSDLPASPFRTDDWPR